MGTFFALDLALPGRCTSGVDYGGASDPAHPFIGRLRLLIAVYEGEWMCTLAMVCPCITTPRVACMLGYDDCPQERILARVDKLQ